MKKVLYVRHGQSVTNLKGVFAGGQDDTPLTELGRLQAKNAGKELQGQIIDRIVTSPLSRTRETAEIIAREVGLSLDVIETDERLREYDIGSGQGTPTDGMTAARLVSFKNAEDPQAFADRIKSALRDISKGHGTTLIVGHAGVGRMIECLSANSDPSEFYDLPRLPNAHPIELDLSWLKNI